MTGVDATAAADGRFREDSRPRLAGHRVTDLSAAVGAVLWLALAGGARGGAIDLSDVALYVALATLVVVPLGLGLVRPRNSAGYRAPYRIAAVGQLPAALAVVGALASPQGSLGGTLLVVPWLGVTSAMALFGLQRLLSRGGGPIPELAIDVAFLYVPVAAAFLLLHAADVDLGFAPIIVLLTAVHFHYAGFVLPLVVGLAGRILATEDGEFAADVAGRVATVTTAVVVTGIAAVAVGITLSDLIEVPAVAAFAVGVLGFSVLVLRDVVPAVPRPAGALLAVAWLSLFWTMALALAFAYGSLPDTAVLVTIPEMVRLHGSVNAFGFALPALLAFRLLDGSTPFRRGR